MTTAIVPRTSLSLGAELGKGGQGRVFAVHGPGGRLTAYKEYRSGATATVALSRMVDDFGMFTPEQAHDWLNRFAWPLQLVNDGSAVSGFLMPAVPDRFYTEWKRTGSGASSRLLAEFQHLLNPPGFIAARGIALDRRRQYELLASLAESLDMLHARRLAVGDLSPRNLLFDINGPAASVYFLDCDAMAYQDGPRHDQVETPGWGVPAGTDGREALGTPASDAYKFGLLALRLLAGSQDATSPRALPDDAAGIRGLLTRALDPDPRMRPTPGQWIPSLRIAAARTGAPPARDTAERTTNGRPPQIGLDLSGLRPRPEQSDANDGLAKSKKTKKAKKKDKKKKEKEKEKEKKSLAMAATPATPSPPAPALPDELTKRLRYSEDERDDHRFELQMTVRSLQKFYSVQREKVITLRVLSGLAVVTAIGFLIAGTPGLTILIPVGIILAVGANRAAEKDPDDDLLEHVGECAISLQILDSSPGIRDCLIDLDDSNNQPVLTAYLVVDTPADSRKEYADRALKALGADNELVVRPDTIHLYAPDGSPSSSPLPGSDAHRGRAQSHCTRPRAGKSATSTRSRSPYP